MFNQLRNPNRKDCRMRKFATLGMLLIFAGVAATSLQAESKFTYGGVYTAWAQSQHNFTLTKDAYDHEYVVQMFRLNLRFAANDHLKAVTRFDISQGWWGVDNALRSVQRTGTGGGSALFDFKDTNYLFHVDQAYVAFKAPKLPIGGRVGRMWYGVGNKLVLDNNLDGFQLDFGKSLTLGWAKVSEGVDNLSDDKQIAPDQRGYTDARDADLYTLDYGTKVGGIDLGAFGLYYKDGSTADSNAYVPDHFQYFKTRFSPQITQLMAFGVTGAMKFGQLSVNGEFDFLTGKDDIDNTIYGAKQMWDKNDGDLSGYNLYLKANYAASDALDIGGVVGLGSGDDDKTGGAGNINKLRTSGFFYLTEIWEDSIMPDEEGITPQGLGAPNVRAYRELENTTAFQINATLKPLDKLSTFVSFTFLQATQPIQAWQSDDADDWQILNTSASDIGQEIDFKVSYKMYKELAMTLRGGYFMPGDAAAYLINGNAQNKENVWELKGTFTYKF